MRPERKNATRAQLALAMLAATCLLHGAASWAAPVDADFSGAVAQLSDWLNGTLGQVIKLAGLLVAMAVGVATNRVAVPIWASMVIYGVPIAFDRIFGVVV